MPCDAELRAMCKISSCVVGLSINNEFGNGIDASSFPLIPMVAGLAALLTIIVGVVVFRKRSRKQDKDLNLQILEPRNLLQHPNDRGISGRRPSGLSLAARSFWGRESARTVRTTLTVQSSEAQRQLQHLEATSQPTEHRIRKVPWVTNRPASGTEFQEVDEVQQVSL